MRKRIKEPARYYDADRLIVVRTGLLIEEERRHLWHEIVHSDRRDEACHATERTENSVEREAVRRAVPPNALRWAMGRAIDWEDLAGLLKLPEEWVRWRVDIAHPGETWAKTNLD